jgi:hypothetical protein
LRTSVTSTASTGPSAGSVGAVTPPAAERERAVALVAVVEHAGVAPKADPPEAVPVFVVVDEDRDVGPGRAFSIGRSFDERFGLRPTAE